MSQKELSPIKYSVISLISLFIGISLLIFYIYKAKDLIESGISNRIFYVILIPFALSCAGFLFGAMNAIASYNGKILGGTIKLGGPAAIFFLVLLGGVKLIEEPDKKPFDVMFAFEDLKGNSVEVDNGEFLIYLKKVPLRALIRQQQYVPFSEIPDIYKGKQVDLEIHSDNFVFKNGQTKTQIILTEEQLSIPLKLEEKCLTYSGIILKNNRPTEGVTIDFENKRFITDSHGEFKIKFEDNSIHREYKLRFYHDSFGYAEEIVQPCIDNFKVFEL